MQTSGRLASNISVLPMHTFVGGGGEVANPLSLKGSPGLILLPVILCLKVAHLAFSSLSQEMFSRVASGKLPRCSCSPHSLQISVCASTPSGICGGEHFQKQPEHLLQPGQAAPPGLPSVSHAEVAAHGVSHMVGWNSPHCRRSQPYD